MGLCKTGLCYSCVSFIDCGPNGCVGEPQGLNERWAVDQQVYRQEAPFCSPTQLKKKKNGQKSLHHVFLNQAGAGGRGAIGVE